MQKNVVNFDLSGHVMQEMLDSGSPIKDRGRNSTHPACWVKGHK